MKVKSVKDSSVIDGGDCWKLAFPMHGCTHAPADAEAYSRVEKEIGRTDRQILPKVLRQMSDAGTYPVELETAKPPAKFEAVPDLRNTVRSEAKGK